MRDRWSRRRQAAVWLMPMALLAGCAPRVLVSLPGGAGVDDPGAPARYTAATAQCRGIRSWSGEVAVAGSVRQKTVRVRVVAGTTADGRVRLEGVAPFGAPLFVFAASGGSASLLLPRDKRVLRGVPADQVLDALVGLSLSTDDLHRLLTGCAAAGAAPDRGRAFGNGWQAVDVGGDRTVYVRDVEGEPRIVAARLGTLSIGYSAFDGGAPRELRIVTTGPAAQGARLRLTLAQVETNVPLPDEAFQLDAPADAQPMSLDELRMRGPGSS